MERRGREKKTERERNDGKERGIMEKREDERREVKQRKGEKGREKWRGRGEGRIREGKDGEEERGKSWRREREK